MNTILRMLEPRSRMGVAVRFAAFVGLIGVVNTVFVTQYARQAPPDIEDITAHALLVGGPFVAFFFFLLMQQVRLQRELSALSRKDGLTGVNNRQTFLDMTNRRRKTSPRGALFLVDADHFKQINDTYGHQVGDTCLQSIAYMLGRNLRENDVIGRIGGEEFAIYLSDATLPQARAIGERLTRPIPFRGADGQHLCVTLSVGVVLTAANQALDDLFLQADRALYQAKADGRARVVIWDEMDGENNVIQLG